MYDKDSKTLREEYSCSEQARPSCHAGVGDKDPACTFPLDDYLSRVVNIPAGHPHKVAFSSRMLAKTEVSELHIESLLDWRVRQWGDEYLVWKPRARMPFEASQSELATPACCHLSARISHFQRPNFRCTSSE